MLFKKKRKGKSDLKEWWQEVSISEFEGFGLVVDSIRTSHFVRGKIDAFVGYVHVIIWCIASLYMQNHSFDLMERELIIYSSTLKNL